MERQIDYDKTNLEEDKSTEDHLFLRRPNLEHRKTSLNIDYNKNNSNNSLQDLSMKNVLTYKGKVTTDDKYMKILKDSFDKVHPLIYLNCEQRKMVLESIVLLKFEQKIVLYSGMGEDHDSGDWAC